MTKRNFVLTIAVFILAIQVHAKEATKAVRTVASASIIPECSDLLKTVIAAAQTAHLEDFKDIMPNVKITNVVKLGETPCGGGPDNCVYTTARGNVTDGTIEGKFVVTAGRGSCTFESLNLHSVQ